MELSHRDHRVDRSLLTGFLAVLALVVTGVLGGALTPWPALGLALVATMAVGAAVYVLRANRSLRDYVEDLRAVHGGGPVDGWVRYEVARAVPSDRSVGVPGGRSPHTRSAGGSANSRP